MFKGLSNNAIQYSWKQLASRIGATRFDIVDKGIRIDNLLLYYGQPEEIESVDSPFLVIVPCSEEAVEGLLNAEPNCIAWASLDTLLPVGKTINCVDDKIPVLLCSEERNINDAFHMIEHKHGNVICHIDIIAITFFMLSRWEEYVSEESDIHGRFSAVSSVSYRQAILDRPIVDEYAIILRAWIQELLSNWMPQVSQFIVKLSHDIDYIRQYNSVKAAVRVLAADILKRRDLAQLGHNLISYIRATSNTAFDPYVQGIYQLADYSSMHGFTSAFYFMTSQPSIYDSGYNVASDVIRRCICDLLTMGHEVGFHPGYGTVDDPGSFAAEKHRMDAILNNSQYGGRQHFLRFQIPHTWRQWEQAGLSYDSTLGYADCEGFRCGTCHPYQPFDIEQDRPLGIIEIPLVTMDVTLRQYRHMDVDKAMSRIMLLAERCKQVEGVFTLLWHNSSLQGSWKPWRVMYVQVLEYLSKLQNPSY